MKDEEFQPSINHWSLAPGRFKERMTRGQLRAILLNHADPIIRGELRVWKSKHIGAGIYEVWTEERKDANS